MEVPKHIVCGDELPRYIFSNRKLSRCGSSVPGFIGARHLDVHACVFSNHGYRIDKCEWETDKFIMNIRVKLILQPNNMRIKCDVKCAWEIQTKRVFRLCCVFVCYVRMERLGVSKAILKLRINFVFLISYQIYEYPIKTRSRRLVVLYVMVVIVFLSVDIDYVCVCCWAVVGLR